MAKTQYPIITSYLSRMLGLLLAILLLSTAGGGLKATPLFAADPPTFTLTFSPSTIGPGSVSTLTHTIISDASDGVRDLAFTNTLPVGVTIATPAAASTTCTGATLTAPDGGSTITFSDGSLPPQQHLYGDSQCDQRHSRDTHEHHR